MLMIVESYCGPFSPGSSPRHGLLDPVESVGLWRTHVGRRRLIDGVDACVGANGELPRAVAQGLRVALGACIRGRILVPTHLISVGSEISLSWCRKAAMLAVPIELLGTVRNHIDTVGDLAIQRNLPWCRRLIRSTATTQTTMHISTQDLALNSAPIGSLSDCREDWTDCLYQVSLRLGIGVVKCGLNDVIGKRIA